MRHKARHRLPRGNLQSPLARPRRDGGGMADFDRLPPPLRRWLHNAALPWSPASVRRVWARALKRTGCENAALAALDRAEAARLAAEIHRR
jgi:hypothetical protein